MLKGTSKSLAKTFLLSVAALACATPALAQTAVNQTGELAAGDTTLNDGEYVDIFTFQGRAGDPFDVTLSSSQFDAYLVLAGPNDFVDQNDDDAAGGTTNARLTTTLPSDGEYTLAFTSLSGGETGRYQARGSFGSGAQQSQRAPQDMIIGPLELNIPIIGSLSSNDIALDSGEYIDSYTFEGRAGTQVVIKLSSSDFDTYLLALDGVDPSNYGVENDDDPNGNGTTNSLLEATIPASGRLTIGATSYASGQTGSYTLVVEPAGGSASGGFRKK